MEKFAGKLECQRYRVPYRIYGSSDKLIVCVSGAKQTMSAWSSFIRYFKSEYSVLVFDLPGQGRSEILSGDAIVPLDDQIELLHRLTQEISISRYKTRYLIGGSWGSIVAAAYVARFQSTFQKAIFASFGTKPNSILDSIIDTVQEYIESGRGVEIAPLMIETFGQYIPASLQRQMISQFETMSEEQFLAFYEHSKTVRRMGDLKKHIDLSGINIPALVIMGQFDTIMDMFDAKNAATLMQDSVFEIVPNAGHFLHWENAKIMDRYKIFFDDQALALSVTA